MERYLLASILIFFYLTNIGHAQIFKWKDADGKIHFSDKKPSDKKSENIQLKINTYKSVTIDPKYFNSSIKASGNKNIIMYSAAWCRVCRKAKTYFNKNNISYTEYDIDKDKAANKRHKEMGATGVPVLFIGGTRMNGFNIASFERLYKR